MFLSKNSDTHQLGIRASPMKEVVTGKNPADKEKEVVLTEEEIPSPHTSTARLMTIEESIAEIFDRMGILETTVERLARGLEEALSALPQQQEIGNGNHQELRCIAGRNSGQSDHENRQSSSESSDEGGEPPQRPPVTRAQYGSSSFGGF